jgi:hypothetical protein
MTVINFGRSTADLKGNFTAKTTAVHGVPQNCTFANAIGTSVEGHQQTFTAFSCESDSQSAKRALVASPLRKMSEGYSSARNRCGEGEAFVDPAGDAADHHLNGQAQPGQTHGRLVGAVAMRPRAIDHEGFFLRILAHLGSRHFAVRDVDRALHMPFGKQTWAAHVD